VVVGEKTQSIGAAEAGLEGGGIGQKSESGSRSHAGSKILRDGLAQKTNSGSLIAKWVTLTQSEKASRREQHDATSLLYSLKKKEKALHWA